MDLNLNGKVAIVTGAGPNIGTGIALALAAYGAKVACNDLVPEAAERVADLIRTKGGEAIAIPGDVTDEAAVVGYVDRVIQEWGRIDILVNNAAAMGHMAGVLDEDPVKFLQAVAVTGVGSMLNTKHVGRHMAANGIRGSIVCISSSSGWLGNPGYIAYSFHKGGINNFVRAAALELAPYGIRVNGYSPTAPTPDNPDVLAKQNEKRDRFAYVHEQGDEPWRRPMSWDGPRPPFAPLGSTGTPTDIGHTVAWMCSDYARLITGLDLTVDGGLRAKNAMHMPADPAHIMPPIPVVPLFDEK